MKLGDFHSMISRDIRRGTSLDDMIPDFTRKGALWIERNNSFQYMRQFGEVHIDVSVDATPRYITIQNTRIKKVDMFRWNVDGTYKTLARGDPRDFDSLSEGYATHYWLDGVERIVLSATPTEDQDGELWLTRYTSWPTVLTSTNWLLDNAEDYLEAVTMLMISRHLRDATAEGRWKSARDEALLGVVAADQELEYSNTDYAMEGQDLQ